MILRVLRARVIAGEEARLAAIRPRRGGRARPASPGIAFAPACRPRDRGRRRARDRVDLGRVRRPLRGRQGPGGPPRALRSRPAAHRQSCGALRARDRRGTDHAPARGQAAAHAHPHPPERRGGLLRRGSAVGRSTPRPVRARRLQPGPPGRGPPGPHRGRDDLAGRVRAPRRRGLRHRQAVGRRELSEFWAADP